MGSVMSNLVATLNSLLRYGFLRQPIQFFFQFLRTADEIIERGYRHPRRIDRFQYPAIFHYRREVTARGKIANRAGTDDNQTNRRRGRKAGTASQRRGGAEMTVHQSCQHQTISK